MQFDVTPTFGPLVPCCKAHGISRSTAYELVAAGELVTFKIGSRTYVTLDSLRGLAERRVASCQKGRRQ